MSYSRILGFLAFAVLALGIVAIVTNPAFSQKSGNNRDPGTGITVGSLGL